MEGVVPDQSFKLVRIMDDGTHVPARFRRMVSASRFLTAPDWLATSSRWPVGGHSSFLIQFAFRTSCDDAQRSFDTGADTRRPMSHDRSHGVWRHLAGRLETSLGLDLGGVWVRTEHGFIELGPRVWSIGCTLRILLASPQRRGPHFRSLSRQAHRTGIHGRSPTRHKVAVADFGSQERTLYIAPTENGGFCYQWTPAYGGCSARSHRISAWGSAHCSRRNQRRSHSFARQPRGIQYGCSRDAARSVSRWLVGYSLDLGAAESFGSRMGLRSNQPW